jgi:hypothetical protein
MRLKSSTLSHASNAVFAWLVASFRSKQNGSAKIAAGRLVTTRRCAARFVTTLASRFVELFRLEVSRSSKGDAGFFRFGHIATA